MGPASVLCYFVVVDVGVKVDVERAKVSVEVVRGCQFLPGLVQSSYWEQA